MPPRTLLTVLRPSITASFFSAPSRRSIITITNHLRAPLKENTTTDPPEQSEINIQVHDSLRLQRSGKGQWKAELASVSEECVKADRDEALPEEGSAEAAVKGPEAIRRLQEKTKGKAEEIRKHMEEIKGELH